MHPYLIGQLATQRRADLLRQAAARRAPHVSGKPRPVTAEPRYQAPDRVAPTRETVLR
jgi:hypothetical protein